eukprot:15364684-Ditylum_brightwellii.AAC.2
MQTKRISYVNFMLGMTLPSREGASKAQDSNVRLTKEEKGVDRGSHSAKVQMRRAVVVEQGH